VLKSNLEFLTWLAQQQCNLNAPDRLGNTPLHYAAQNGEPDIVATLIQYGANPQTRNNRGQTPKRMADIKVKKYFKPHVVKALQQPAQDGDDAPSGTTQMETEGDKQPLLQATQPNTAVPMSETLDNEGVSTQSTSVYTQLTTRLRDNTTTTEWGRQVGVDLIDVAQFLKLYQHKDRIWGKCVTEGMDTITSDLALYKLLYLVVFLTLRQKARLTFGAVVPPPQAPLEHLKKQVKLSFEKRSEGGFSLSRTAFTDQLPDVLLKLHPKLDELVVRLEN
jgi:hypothetical protein